MRVRYLLVISEVDPVARRVAATWGTPPATGDFVDAVPLRDLGDGVLELRRPGLHIHDENLDGRLPSAVRTARPTLVFPSIHRSRENVNCLTVHALGNFGPTAEVGGRPRTLNPTDPRAMANALRRLSEAAGPLGWSATYEATHHGPELDLPSFFAEIGYGTALEPPEPVVRVLAQSVRTPVSDAADRIALAVGGGHYAPHFTDLALRRHWAFGHIVSRHSLKLLDRTTARAAFAAMSDAAGIVFARAADAELPAFDGVGPRLRDSAADPIEPSAASMRSTDASRSSGT